MAIIRLTIEDGTRSLSRENSVNFEKPLGPAQLAIYKETVDGLTAALASDILLDLEASDRPEVDMAKAVGKILAPVLGTPVEYAWEADGLFHLRFGANEVAKPTVREAVEIALNQWCILK